jgi:hypothetical protein
MPVVVRAGSIVEDQQGQALHGFGDIGGQIRIAEGGK